MPTGSTIKNTNASSVLLFDGVCNLCNGFVQFIVKRDPKAKIQFASLQSAVAKSILRKHQLPTEQLHSVFIIFPKGLRDRVYDWIAANRYRWFGKQESCMVPNADLSPRFLD